MSYAILHIPSRKSDGIREKPFRVVAVSLSLLGLLCLNGAAVAQSFEEAVALHDAGKHEQALAIFMARAEDGEASSMYNVAEMHR